MLDAESTGGEHRIFDVTISKPSESGWYLFEPARAKYLWLACHGISRNTWNSIHDVKIASFAKDNSEPVVTASGAVKDYPAESTIDVTLEPVKGKALLCGAIPGPVGSGR